MDKAFKTFTRQGVKFLAVPQGRNVMICDESANNYGAYQSIESFDKLASESGVDRLMLGQIQVEFNCLPM